MPKPVNRARRAWRSLVPMPIRRALRAPIIDSPAQLAAAGRDRLGPGAPGGINRLHVGCGPHNLMVDWWNVDIRGFAGIDQVADVTQPWPWHDLDYVYGEHFLEHLPLDDAIRFLGQAAAGLRPDGRLRLSTPGLEWIWRTNFSPSGPNAEMVAMTYRVNRSFYGWGHRFLYSRPMLEHVLLDSGFTDLTFHRFGESPDPDLRGLEQHGGFDVVDSWPSVWIVEAVPAGTASATALMAEAEHELERHRRSGH